MSRLGTMLAPLLDADGLGKVGRDIIETLEAPANLVSQEQANKAMSSIRQTAQNGTTTVITKLGRQIVDDASAVVMSAGLLAQMMHNVYLKGEKRGAERKSPSAVLNLLLPIEGNLGDVQIGGTVIGETVGGHGKLSVE